MCAATQNGLRELPNEAITTLKRIGNGGTNGLDYTDAEIAPLLQAGYVEEYMRPVLSITDDGTALLKEIYVKETASD